MHCWLIPPCDPLGSHRPRAQQLKFSMALKDFHDAMKIGVQKTLVAEDGMGHAFCKVHCKRLPRHEDIAREPHLRNHWIPLTGSRWVRCPFLSAFCRAP